MTHVLIAGGGLTGSALAIQVGRLGLSVELFERAHFPREKPCGEGLMPAGVAAIERLGLNARAGAPFQTDFGITPIKVGGGSVKVKNKVRIRFELVAEK